MVLKNSKGRSVLLAMTDAVHQNRQYLSDLDGLIGDGDHGVNMNKGFMLYSQRLGDKETGFCEGLSELGMILLNEIGGSMGPIYGTIFMEMADAAEGLEKITLEDFDKMLTAGLQGLYEIVDAREGDKTLVDTLAPCTVCMHDAVYSGLSFCNALENMKKCADRGLEATRDMTAKYGRAARLGERSIGVLDAGAASCCIILKAMADGIKSALE